VRHHHVSNPEPPAALRVDGEAESCGRGGRLWAGPSRNSDRPHRLIGPDRESFVPFAVGYVELPGEVKVETR